MSSPHPPSPPRAPAVKYKAPHGTRWDKEKAAAGGAKAFDLPSDPKVLGPWIIGECVGKGASGRVKIARHRYTNQLAAVKILPRAPLDCSRNSIATQEAKTKKHSFGIEREITMMKLMNHPNILRIYDVYEGSTELFLVLEYVEGGELFDYLVNQGRLTEPVAICFFKQIIYGLNYAHTFSIIHRDLKPENILISSFSPPQIKIVDWGMAAFAPPSLQLETSCGSPHYASPEIVNGYKYTGNATDIWSCGVILYALLTGRLPFDDKDVKVLLGKVKAGKYQMPDDIDLSAQDLLSKMLVLDVHRRITIPEILSHPWLNTSPAARRYLSIASSFEVLKPVLPPSPSTVARPIANPSSIDPEILFSLKIIWSRHAGTSAILKDLGSPAGKGVHTKAFYWLLLRHHEEAEKLASDNQEDDSVNGMGPGSVTFNLGWELDTSGLGGRHVTDPVSNRGADVDRSYSNSNPRYDFQRGDPARQPSNSLLPPLMITTATDPSTTSPRSRSNSPGGPRLPNVPRPTYERTSDQQSSSGQRSVPSRSSSQPNSSFDIGNLDSGGGKRSGSVLSGGHGGPRPQPPKRGNTYSHPRSIKPSPNAPSVPSPSSGATVSTVKFPPAHHPVQNTQSHRPVPRPPRARSATTADVSMGEENRVSSRPHLQARPHSQTSQIPAYGGGTSLKRATSSVHSGTDSSSGSSTACSITSTATLHAPVPMKVDSSESEIPVDIASTPPSLPQLTPLQPLPPLEAPKLADPVLQMELDGLAAHVNRLSLPLRDREDVTVDCNSGRDLQTQLREYRPQQRRPLARQVSSYQQQRFQSPKSSSARRRAVSTVERGVKGVDKENKENANAGLGDESWSYVVADEGTNCVSGRGVIFANGGNHKPPVNEEDKGKKEKDRKARPHVEFPPLNRKRSTISALGSPITLSPPMNASSTKAGLGSPVVGEFKGWLSNLFGRPNKNSVGNCIFYSADDIAKTRQDVLHLLASLGVIVEASLSEPGSERDHSPLRCRVDELTAEGLAYVGMKPVRFRIEFSAIGDEVGSGLFSISPAPLSNGNHLFSAAAASGVRGRSSTLGGIKSPLPSSPLPSLNFVAASVMIVIQEKGSSSTFKAIWRKLKEVYDDGCGGENPYAAFSPVMTSTPLMEQQYVV